MKRIPALLPLVFLIHSMAPPAGAGTPNWDSSFGLPGVAEQGFTGAVYASAEFQGDLVIGGSFDAIGGLAVSNLARWDGTGWAPMGDSFDDPVEALIVWNGDLYAGGGFTAVGATSASGLARWNGSAWVDAGGGPVSAVLDLGIYDGDLVVAGYDFGGGGIAVWDGASWDDLDGGIYGTVYGVEEYASSLYACGEFDLAGGAFAANLARWNGTAWSSVGGGLFDSSGDPYGAYGSDLAVYGGDLVIGGYFERAGSLTVDGIARWNGSSFSALGTSFFGGDVNALGLFGGDLVAASSDFASVERWNGSFWFPLSNSSDGGFWTFLEFGGDLIAGGIFTTLDGEPMASLSRYDGSVWSPLADGEGASGTRAYALHDWNGTIVAGGRLSRLGTVPGLLAAWDGSAWTSLGTGIPASGISNVRSMATFETDLIVSGSFSNAGGTPVNGVARWDGSNWTAMGTEAAGALLALDGELYATGYWGSSPNVVQTMGQWNGSSFDPLGGAISGGAQTLFALGSFQGDPVMGGSFTSVDGVAANYVARWDGANWQPLGSGTGGTVNAIHEAGGVLYVAGSFTTAGGSPAARVAAWDGSAWSPLAGGLLGTVRSLASIGGDLFATGTFALADGQPVNRIARWDGAAWHALGSGLDDDGWALLAQGDDLWVGGEFTLAGPTGSSRIARWTSPSTTSAPFALGASSFSIHPPRPNPTQGATSFDFSLRAAANVTIDVFDVRGARVRTLARESLSAGSHTIAWDGRDAGGRPVPAGVYFVKLREAGPSAGRKVIMVR